MTLIFVLLSACGGSGWTDEAALAPTMARLDADGDGAIDEAEYRRVFLRAPEFSVADADGSGGVTEDELLARFLAEDPTSVAPPPGSANTRRRPGKNGGKGGLKEQGGSKAPRDDRKADVLDTRFVLLALASEIRAAAPDEPLPEAKELFDAADSGSVKTLAGRAVLAKLELAAGHAGLTFPPSLRAEALAAEPVVEAYAPEHLEPVGGAGPRSAPERGGQFQGSDERAGGRGPARAPP